ncbi:MAG: lycopene beta-cyclase CrtY [Myxococcaceae bacterium]
MKDVVLVGGGLANGLLADRLLAADPSLDLVMLEAAPEPGGNHTWSFHHGDVPAETFTWLEPWVSRSWEGHDVYFPSRWRALGGRYHSVRSEDFARRVRTLLGPRLRTSTSVKHVAMDHVVLGDGERLDARLVIDARGFLHPRTAPCGWQKFLGLELTLAAPHGLVRPLLMDATVEQLDGFRFLYALPWDERRVLVEDTRYSDDARVDREAFEATVRAWVSGRGWTIASVDREECASLPIPLEQTVPHFDVPTLGVAGGFFHTTTGYSLPFAARLAEQVTKSPLRSAAVLELLRTEARAHHREMGFFRVLNRMLFRGAAPATRVRIFDSFYEHPEPLIERFYAGRLTFADKLAALRRGAPTVPLGRAMRAVFT